MAPSTTHAPAPSAPGEWQSLHENLLKTSAPCLIVSASAVCAGGLGTGGTVTRGYGNGVVAPSLNANSREGPRLDSGVAMTLTGPKLRECEPNPTGTNTYCSPFAAKLTGTASIAEPVSIDQSFRPVSAPNASNVPVPSPWNTKLPAVDSTPLLVGKCSMTDQRTNS